MQPQLRLLDKALTERVLTEAFGVMMEPGVRVSDAEAISMLGSAGAIVDGDTARIPEALTLRALGTAPRHFQLHNRGGEPTVHYGGDAVQFDPGSSCLNVLDAETLLQRPALTSDLVGLVQVAEMLPQFAAQSTAVVCIDVPASIGDLYRLYVVLLHSDKPIVTGAFADRTTDAMIELLAADAGGHGRLAAAPRAVFDVCPLPPLHWTAFAARNVTALARAQVPVEIVSMPLAGASAPVTLLGTVVQHAAETLAGITIHQLACPGAPVVWGGAPAIFDMRAATTPMGAIETAMLAVSHSQVGKQLGLPTHTYLGASDAKIVDAQAGMETGITVLIGALAGINMISGAGMLDFLACISAEKLVLDAEAIAMAQRFLEGMRPLTPTLAADALAAAGHQGDFLPLEETRRLYRAEQHLPSAVIERRSLRAWQEAGAGDSFARARSRLSDLVARYAAPALAPEVFREMEAIMLREARRAGIDRLPVTPAAG